METRRSARLPKYDYGKQGVYFVTLCTYQRQCTLSTVGRDDLGAPYGIGATHNCGIETVFQSGCRTQFVAAVVL